MHIPNRAGILVTDGRKMLLFRNEGDADYPNFRAVVKEEDDNPPDRFQKKDAPGRTTLAGGDHRRSAYDEDDRHRREEERFAVETMELVNRRMEDGSFDRLLVVADPRTLGTLRGHYGHGLEQRLIGEVAKDLVKHPVAEIERILCAG
jgi:protein required for attachment to host cells